MTLFFSVYQCSAMPVYAGPCDGDGGKCLAATYNFMTLTELQAVKRRLDISNGFIILMLSRN